MLNGFTRTELSELMWQKPYFVQLELTRNCNYRCIFCFENCDRNDIYEDASYEQWIKVIDGLAKLGVKQIHFSGGENFLHKDFAKIVKYAKEKEFYIIINTNGFFDITPIIEYSDEFIFSLHGYDEVNDKITRMKNTFEKVENNIKLATKANKKILINTVLVKDNFDKYIELLEYLENKYDNLRYSPTIAIECKTGKKFFDSIEINKENMMMYKKILEKVGEEKIVYKHGLRGLVSQDNKKEIDMPVCAAGKSKLIIKYNGNVYPCNFFQTDEYLCGNVFTQDVNKIWNEGKGFEKFRKYYLKRNLPEKCNKCEKINNCFSGCRAWTKSYIDGDMNIKEEGDIRCEFIDAFARA